MCWPPATTSPAPWATRPPRTVARRKNDHAHIDVDDPTASVTGDHHRDPAGGGRTRCLARVRQRRRERLVLAAEGLLRTTGEHAAMLIDGSRKARDA